MSCMWCISVAKKDGEKVRQRLLQNSLLNRDIKIQSENGRLLFPLSRELMNGERQKLVNDIQGIKFELREMEISTKKKPLDLATALKDYIPESLLEYIPKSFDIVGNLIILEIAEEIESYERVIGTMLLELHPSISAVYKKLEGISGEYRLRNIQIIAGKDVSVTVHKENDCLFELDVKQVYFSPRLATERLRVASKVESEESILDMFAGVGPFSILIAKRKRANILAVDINPAAILYLKRNIKLNKVEEYVTPVEGNIKEVTKNVQTQFDRIIMNLPEKAVEFLDLSCKLLKEGGIIHYYAFVSESESFKEIKKKLQSILEQNHRTLKEVLEIRRVRAYAPYKLHIGIDFSIN